MPASSVTSILRQGLRYFYGESQFRDFSGGLNIRDAQSELAPNESPDLYNVTLDERGAIGKRLGYAKYNGTVYNASKVTNVFYWTTGQNLIVQSGADLFKDTGLTSLHTFTTADRCGFADFTGLLYVIHPIDGLFKYDGATFSAVAAGPKGKTLSPWQNKLWAAGDPANKPRVYFSNAGDGTLWGGTAFVDLREKDTEIVTCLAGASGLDVSGRPGLLAFKRRSGYRIFDSTTGQFQTLDPQIGAASAMSVVSSFQRTVALSEKGIYWTDGVGPMRAASDKLQPLFDPVQISYPNLDLFCAGVKGDRMYFSLPRAGSSANDTMIEYHPIQGWMTANSNAASCYATFGKDTEILYSGSPTVNGQVYQQLAGGSDDGAAITSRYQMKWVELTAGHPVRVTRARVIGRGIFTLNVFTDYQLSASLALNVNLSASAAIYDNAGSVFDNAGTLYGPLRYQSFVDFPQLGVLKAISIQYTETSTATGSGLPILGGAAPTIGSWGNYGVSISYVPLGLS